jgi:hypothetical protein
MFKVPGEPKYCASTPSSRLMIELIGSKMNYEGVHFSSDEVKYLKVVYGFSDVEHERMLDKACAMAQVDYEGRLARYEKERAQNTSWHVPLKPKPPYSREELDAFYTAGDLRNLARYVQRDGLRVMAVLARYVEADEDPVQVLLRMAIEAGYAVDPSDIEWAEGQDVGQDDEEGEEEAT